MMKKFIPVAIPNLSGNEKKYVDDCMDSTWISSKGKYIDMFEKGFSKYCGVKQGIACSNGTTALHPPLIALGVGPGDEVLVPTLTYIATANAVSYCGAKPVFVDCDAKTWNISPTALEAKITSRTKGIIVVHLYGNPVDMDPIMDIAKKHNLFVIEDAAEAHGALYHDKRVGSIGHVGVFSFFANKVITTGEGGMIITDDDVLAAKMRLIKGQGMDPNHRYWFTMIGYNYRMTNIEAAIGVAQLENIDKHIALRKQVHAWYMKYFKGFEKYIDFQQDQPGGQNVYWMVSILLKDTCNITRDALMEKMASDGIETRPVFYPLHQMPPYYEKDESSYKNANAIAAAGINLPTSGLLTEDDVKYICETVLKYVK